MGILAPIPGVLGNDLSGSKGEDGGGGDASLSRDVEVRSVDCRRPMKTPLVEESEDESEHGPPSACPLNPTPLIGSHQEEDIEMDPTKGNLFLGKCSLVLVLPCVFVLCFCY